MGMGILIAQTARWDGSFVQLGHLSLWCSRDRSVFTQLLHNLGFIYRSNEGAINYGEEEAFYVCRVQFYHKQTPWFLHQGVDSSMQWLQYRWELLYCITLDSEICYM